MYQQHGYGGHQPHMAAQQQQQQQWVPVEQHNNILKNFRLAHEQVETQRKQMEEQEKIVASLKERISRLEGADQDTLVRPTASRGGSSVDDFSIR
ncbi:hypothetical protein FRC18_004638, partial [Serendipita sp. 400]